MIFVVLFFWVYVLFALAFYYYYYYCILNFSSLLSRYENDRMRY